MQVHVITEDGQPLLINARCLVVSTNEQVPFMVASAQSAGAEEKIEYEAAVPERKTAFAFLLKKLGLSAVTQFQFVKL